METFGITRISETDSFPVVTKYVVHLCNKTNDEIYEDVIYKFAKSEGCTIAGTPNPIKKVREHTWAVLVMKPNGDADIWTLLILMELTLPSVANGQIAYEDCQRIGQSPI